jgi:hypothetical protein
MRQVTWRKSSYSSGQDETSECVEVAVAEAVVGVRDSKNRAAGRLAFPIGSWRAFLRS